MTEVRSQARAGEYAGRFAANLLGAVAFMTAFSAFAADVVWQGPNSGSAEWSDTANWSGGELPKSGDTAVFGDGVGTLNISTGTGNIEIPAGGFKVASGTVTLLEGCTFRVPAVTNVIDVATGAQLNIRCGYQPPNSNTLGGVRKTGGGVLEGPGYNTSGWFGSNGYSRYFQFVHVAEGTMKFPGFRVYVRSFYTAAGATLTIGAISTLCGNIFEVEKGGIVNISSSGNNYVGNLIGEGTVNFSYGNGASSFSLYQGPFSFQGLINSADNVNLALHLYGAAATTWRATTDEEKHFYICKSNTLAGVRYLTADITPEFMPNIGSFYMGRIVGAGVPVVTEDMDGAPIRLYAGLSKTKPATITGSGDFYLCYDDGASLTGAVMQITGTLGVASNVTKYGLVLGDGTEAGRPDLSSVKAIQVDGGYLNVNNADVVPPICGKGTMNVSGPSVLRQLDLTASGTVNLYADATILGGNAVIPGMTLYNDATLAVTNASLHGPYVSSGDFYTYTKLPGCQNILVGVPDTTYTKGQIVIGRGGEVRFGGVNDNPLCDVVLADGGRLVAGRDSGWRSKNHEEHSIYADGGVIATTRFYGPAWNFIWAEDLPYWTARIGKKGLTYLYADNYADYFKETGTFKGIPAAVSDVTGGRDGGITFAIANPLEVSTKQDVTGPVTIRDGWVLSTLGGAPFGSGDFVLDGGQIGVPNSTTTDYQLKLASGAGAKLRVESTSTIDFSVFRSNNWNVNETAQTFTIGAVDAKETPLAFEPGAVLHVLDNWGKLDGTYNRLYINGGAGDTNTDGRVLAPMFICSRSNIHFAQYDATKGLTEFGGYVGFASATADNTVSMEPADGNVTLSEDRQVGAIRFRLPTASELNTTYLKIPSGTTLTIGSGTAPACVIAGCGFQRTGTIFSGDGTVDFGPRMGYFAVSVQDNAVYSSCPIIDVKLSGTGGVSFSGGLLDENAYYTLKCASDYTGGTYVESVGVFVENGQALGLDRVYVNGRRFMNNSAVVFKAAMTMANDFTISGIGMQPSRNIHNYGALQFAANGVTLTGAVTIEGEARVTAQDAGAGESGTFAGVIDGGRLQLYKAKDAPIVFTQDNTYTGGTEIVSASATLRGAKPSLGTGDILIDDGTLRFENTAALTITNRLEGVGTFVLAGEPEVTFAGDCSDMTATVELTAGKHTFTAMPPFKTLVAPASGRTTLVFPANRGTIEWDGTELSGAADSFILDIGTGTILDLGGKTLTVRRAVKDGALRVINGKINETHPELGMSILIR